MVRNTLILAGLVVLLWGAWYAFSSHEKTDLSIRERRDFFKADSLAIDSMAVRYGSWTHLGRHGDEWTVYFPDWSYSADRNLIHEIFRFTNEMVLENIISARAEKHQSFEVDTTRGTVFQFYAAGQPQAEFVMGKGGVDAEHTYIRQLHSDSVYLARGDFQRIFRRVPVDWGSKVISRIDSTNLAAIRWITKDSEVRVARGQGGGWLVYKNNNAAGLPVDSASFSYILRTITPFRADAFAMDGTGVAAETENPYIQMILESTDGSADTLLWNHPVESDKRMFAFRAGRPKPLFIFYKGKSDRLNTSFRDLVLKDGAARSGQSEPSLQ